MKFCDNCQNMLYLTVKDDCKLVQYCKNCNLSVEEDYSTSAKVVISNKYKDDTSSSQYKNKNIIYDATLPRVNNIDCKKNCAESQGKENEVIYIKYDHMNMKYIYFCCHCKEFWV